MGRKELLILLWAFCMIGCISFYQHTDGTLRPKKPKFSLVQKLFKVSNTIDTVAIYESLDTFKYDIYKSLIYMKFYNNGRFFISSKSVPSLLTEYNFHPGNIGYYFLSKDGIETEYYFVDPLNKYKTEYTKQKGIVKGDTIFLEKQFIKGKKDVYVKRKLNFVPKPSNW